MYMKLHGYLFRTGEIPRDCGYRNGKRGIDKEKEGRLLLVNISNRNCSTLTVQFLIGQIFSEELVDTPNSLFTWIILNIMLHFNFTEKCFLVPFDHIS